VPTKTWKTHPAYLVLLEILAKKGAMTDAELFEALSADHFEDMGARDFNELLMRLEIGGKIRTSSMTRGKRRIEIVT
jgi:hypothetical protein